MNDMRVGWKTNDAGWGDLTSYDLLFIASLIVEYITEVERLVSKIYDEVDARFDIAANMSLTGEAAAQGKLITDEWLWNDMEVEEETA